MQGFEELLAKVITTSSPDTVPMLAEVAGAGLIHVVAGDEIYVLTVRKTEHLEPDFEVFDVELISCGDKKIHCIKEIRAIASIGLKDAKDLVDRTGDSWDDSDSAQPPFLRSGSRQIVLKDVSRQEAADAVQRLEAIGAKVECNRTAYTAAEIELVKRGLIETVGELTEGEDVGLSGA